MIWAWHSSAPACFYFFGFHKCHNTWNDRQGNKIGVNNDVVEASKEAEESGDVEKTLAYAEKADGQSSEVVGYFWG